MNSSNRKIILIVVGVLVMICACVAVAALIGFRQFNNRIEQAFVTDPTQAAVSAEAITVFDLPEGFSSTSLDLFGIQVLTLTGPQPDETILIMQIPPDSGLSRTEMEAQLSNLQSSQVGNLTFETVETRTYTIRGQEVSVNVREAENVQGVVFRQAVGFFDGRGGPALVMYQARADDWDDGLFEQFLASLK
jgi:hypothetical protein